VKARTRSLPGVVYVTDVVVYVRVLEVDDASSRAEVVVKRCAQTLCVQCGGGTVGTARSGTQVLLLEVGATQRVRAEEQASLAVLSRAV